MIDIILCVESSISTTDLDAIRSVTETLLLGSTGCRPNITVMRKSIKGYHLSIKADGLGDRMAAIDELCAAAIEEAANDMGLTWIRETKFPSGRCFPVPLVESAPAYHPDEASRLRETARMLEDR